MQMMLKNHTRKKTKQSQEASLFPSLRLPLLEASLEELSMLEKYTIYGGADACKFPAPLRWFGLVVGLGLLIAVPTSKIIAYNEKKKQLKAISASNIEVL